MKHRPSDSGQQIDRHTVPEERVGNDEFPHFVQFSDRPHRSAERTRRTPWASWTGGGASRPVHVLHTDGSANPWSCWTSSWILTRACVHTHDPPQGREAQETISRAHTGLQDDQALTGNNCRHSVQTGKGRAKGMLLREWKVWQDLTCKKLNITKRYQATSAARGLGMQYQKTIQPPNSVVLIMSSSQYKNDQICKEQFFSYEKIT